VNEVPAALERAQSLGEEIANSVSHGVGLLAAMIAAPVLVLDAMQRGGAATVLGAGVFAATMVLLYLASTLYHALPQNRAKRVFRALDHGAIFLLIAGTYTPFTLGVLRGTWGWLGLGDCRSDSEGRREAPIPRALDVPLSGHGVAGADRGSTVVASRPAGRSAVAVRGGDRLHGRRGVLRGAASALQPLCLAPVRSRGHRLSLLRRALVRGLTAW